MLCSVRMIDEAIFLKMRHNWREIASFIFNTKFLYEQHFKHAVHESLR